MIVCECSDCLHLHFNFITPTSRDVRGCRHNAVRFMSLFGSLVKPHSSATAATIASRSMPACSSRVRSAGRWREDERTRRLDVREGTEIRTLSNKDETFENLFIRSLVAAGQCSQHRHPNLGRTDSGPRHVNLHNTHPIQIRASIRNFSAYAPRSHRRPLTVPEGDEEDEQPIISKDEYKELVNTYPSFQGKKIPAKYAEPAGRHPRLAPRLVMSAEEEEEPPPRPRQVIQPEDDITRKQVRRVKQMLRGELGRVPLERLWNAYEVIPAPRPHYFSDANLRHMFRHLTWVEFKSVDGAMERYMRLLEDCIAQGIPLTQNIWNSAIAFCARWLRQVTSEEVRAAVETWKRMEASGHEATNVTFNILFDAAIRAGRFGLADTIYSELLARNMLLNRFLRTSVIYYAGLRKNGDSVRKAFRDLVNAGEIVDTAVMNCVMASLVRSGEGAAAENVFQRMRSLHEQKFSTASPRSWQTGRKLGRILDRQAHELRQERDQLQSSFFGTAFSTVDRKEAIQEATPIAPNARSYRILITYHTSITGDIERARALLDEMRQRGLHVHGSIYYNYFLGFFKYGGFPRTAWSRGALEDVWADFTAALGSSDTFVASSTTIKNENAPDVGGQGAKASEDSVADAVYDEFDSDRVPGTAELDRAPYFTLPMAKAIIRSFYRCAGRRRMVEVWSEIVHRWDDVPREDRLVLQQIVDTYVQAGDAYVR